MRPYVLTIAGFDPSNGAGLTADIKTFEALKTYGVSICTANTVQNDIDFKSCHWVDIGIVKNQLEVLFDRFKIQYVKIGIIQDWETLNEIIDFLLKKNPEIKIVLDPVLIYLLTPNYQEINKLFTDKTIKQTITHIQNKTNLFLKGGHREDHIGKDELFTKEAHFVMNPKMKNISEKHGSGCVLSSAITAYLALGFPLLKSCYRAKRYTEKVLSSNEGLLGYHKM